MKFGLAASAVAAMFSVREQATKPIPVGSAVVKMEKAGHSRRVSQKKRRLMRRRVS